MEGWKNWKRKELRKGRTEGRKMKLRSMKKKLKEGRIERGKNG